METSTKDEMSWVSRALWQLAKVAVILAVVVLMLHSQSPFLCVEIGGFLIGLLVISAVTFPISHPMRKRITWLALATVLGILAVGYVHYKASANCLFRDFVVDPMPNSVRILNSQSEFAKDYAIFLHFQLAPGDLDTVLRKRAYIDARERGTPRGPGAANLPWWKPDSLAIPTVYYWEEKGTTGAVRHAAWLWINEARTEAFFTYWSF